MTCRSRVPEIASAYGMAADQASEQPFLSLDTRPCTPRLKMPNHRRSAIAASIPQCGRMGAILAKTTLQSRLAATTQLGAPHAMTICGTIESPRTIEFFLQHWSPINTLHSIFTDSIVTVITYAMKAWRVTACRIEELVEQAKWKVAVGGQLARPLCQSSSLDRFKPRLACFTPTKSD